MKIQRPIGRIQYGRETIPELSKGLGLLGIAAGAAKLLAPKQLADWLGIDGAEPVIRACGAREVLSGAALTALPSPEPFLWTRVVGDVADIAGLSLAMSRSRHPERVGMVLAGVAAVTALDLLCAVSATRTRLDPQRPGRESTDGLPHDPEALEGERRDKHWPKEEAEYLRHVHPGANGSAEGAQAGA